MTYQVRTQREDFGGKFEIYELRDLETNSWLKICPERGGMVVSFAPYGQELLYLDERTLVDLSRNVRGGIPVLWPICGQLHHQEYEWNGKTYQMANHGLARRFAWSVADVNTEGRAAITLKFSSNEQTKTEFPFDFELIFTYVLQDGRLIIEQTYTNKSTEPMPMYAGFHPYFLSDDKALHYQTDAKTYLDYNDGSEKKFSGIVDLNDKVESVVLLGATKPHIAFAVPTPNREQDEGNRSNQEARTVQLAYEFDFRYVVLWTVKDKPFVCVEPWMAVNGSLNSKQGLVMVSPDQSHRTSVTLWAHS